MNRSGTGEAGGIVLPAAIAARADTDVSLLFAGGRGGADAFERREASCNAEISKVILRQTLSTETPAGGGGSYAATKGHLEVRADVIDADKRLVEEVINRQLLAPLVRLNLGEAPLPVFRFFEEDEPPTAWVKVLVDLGAASPGIEVPKGWLHGKLNIPEAKAGEEVVRLGTAPAAPVPPPQFSEPPPPAFPDQAAVDQAADALALDEALRPMVEEALRLAATDPEEALNRLSEILPDDSGAAERLARALFVMEIWGRLHGRG